ncbi:energy transducer TonB [Flagellimonas pelagia]|uniref:Energy transducer TonB n=1 Tax=Flagellimonas pelagia TaxID=2306998 RepID=A0A3A1NHR6_9FLAO|nr:energy transducer TonB [Allomuricauda maritima]RIV43159.1 energy transducer TonB [Allomuricauda maritima]TXJ92094.1 TonB family protein [Allomuricauda maritima]
MKPKKNPQLELKRNSKLYFSIGMACVLLLAYMALEWKSYDTQQDWDHAGLKIDKELIEEAPHIKIKLPDPPKPKIQTPPEIKIADDEEKIEESVIEAEDTNQDTEIVDVEDIEVADDDIPDTVPFITIENAPVFPGCENEPDEKAKKACFQEMMLKHINKTIRYPELAQEMGLQGRVSVVFTVQKDGSIGDVQLRGPHESLEKEAGRIISKLPKMTPGKQRGTPVKVPYAIPITFKLN